MPEVARTVVIIGPVDAKGGISSVIHTIVGSGEIQRRFGVTMVGTSMSRDAPAWMEPLVSARALWRFTRLLLLDRSIRLVHIHSSAGWSLVRKSVFALISRLARVPYVIHLHTGQVLNYLDAGHMTWFLFRAALKNAARAVFLAAEFEEPVRRAIPGISTQVLSNPVALAPSQWGRALTRDKPEPVRVLFVGFLLQDKGVLDLVEAAGQVARVRSLELRLCGKGPLESELRALAARQSTPWIQVVGWVDGERLASEYAEAGVFTLPSAGEGVPMSMLDAMACGLPCIATRVGGIPSILDDGIEGYLLQPGDIDTLAERLAGLVSDPALRRQMGERAVARAAGHAPEVLARAWADMYEDVIEAVGH